MNTVALAIGSPDGAVNVPRTVGLCEKRTSRVAPQNRMPRPPLADVAHETGSERRAADGTIAVGGARGREPRVEEAPAA